MEDPPSSLQLSLSSLSSISLVGDSLEIDQDFAVDNPEDSYQLHPAVSFYFTGADYIENAHDYPLPPDHQYVHENFYDPFAPYEAQGEDAGASGCVSTAPANEAGCADSRAGDWSTLPEVVVINIMQYLSSDLDRLNMALTCASWSSLLNSACLWRFREIDLTQPRITEARALQFSERHGEHLHNLVISCRHPSYTNCKRFQKAVTAVFGRLSGKARLRELRMPQLELERYWRYEVTRDKLVSSIVRFVRSQRLLEAFDMTAAQLHLTSGIKILEAVSSGSGESLTTLCLEDFFHSRISAFRTPRFVCAMKQLTNLSSIHVNYNCLSEEILESLAGKCAHKLHHMSIKVYKNDPHFHRIPGYAWKKARRRCPCLTVDVEFDQVPKHEDILAILIPDVPLRALHLWSGYVDDDDWRVNDTLTYIASTFSKTLDSLMVEIDSNSEEIDDGILRVVNECKGLSYVDVNAVISISTIEAICELQEQGKINLRKFNVTACGMTDIDMTELRYVEERFRNMIESRGLKFSFSTDLQLASGDGDTEE